MSKNRSLKRYQKKYLVARHFFIPLFIIIGLIVVNFAITGDFLFMEVEFGEPPPPPPGSPPVAVIHDASIAGTFLNIDFTVSDADTQIRSYYVSLYIEGRLDTFLFEKGVADGPYGPSVSVTQTIDLLDFHVETSSDESKTIRVECTDTDGRYGKAEKAVAFAIAYPDAPSSLGVAEWNSLGNDRIILQWAPPEDSQEPVLSYNIYRAADDASFVLRGNVAHPDTTYEDTIIPGNNYVYRVVSVGHSGEGEGIALKVITGSKDAVTPGAGFSIPLPLLPVLGVVMVLGIIRKRRRP